MSWRDDALASDALCGTWTLLLRHAERPPIPPGGFGENLVITEDGRVAAEALGRLLGGRLKVLLSSPVRRCVETAEAIRRGAQADVTVELDRRLGDPGVWIVDSELAGPEFLRLGAAGVVRRQLRGDRISGMRSLVRGTKLLLDLLRISAAADGGTVAVSHDAVIAPFVGHVLGSKRVSDVMPLWLEGPVLRLDDGVLQWRSECRPLGRRK